MAKKKKSQNTIDNRDKRFISEVFDAGDSVCSKEHLKSKCHEDI